MTRLRSSLSAVIGVAAAAVVHGQVAPPKAAPTPAASPRPAPRPAAKPTPAAPVAIEGVVSGPDRKPIEKALVVATAARERMFSAPEAPRTARTDAQGRFRIVLKKRDAQTVRVEAAGLASRTLRDVAPGTPLAIDLVRGGRIEGTARDGDTGQPVGDATIEARDRDAVAVVGETGSGRVASRSDANGRFVLDGLASGMHSITARSAAGGYALKSNVRVGGRVDLLLFPAATVTGTVTGPDGRAVAGATVQAYGASGRSSQPMAESTDAQGRFALVGLPAGTYAVIATSAQRAPAVASNVVLDRRSEAELDLRLGAGARVIGRLVDVRDRPLAGRVSVGELDGQSPPAVLADALSADAGADGRFAIEMVPSGDHALAAIVPGHAFQRVEFTARASDVRVDVGDVRVEVGLAIRGRVRDASGQAVADATLMAMPMRQIAKGGSARSEADGTFVLAGLEQTPHRLLIEAPGFARADKTAEPGPDPIDLVLERGATLAGQVVDDRGRPVEDYRVSARSVEERGFSRMPRGEQVSSTDGRFRLDGLASGAYAVTVSAPERAPTTVSGVRVAAGADLDLGTIKLGAGGIVRGSVVDEAGAFVAGARVIVRGQGRDWFASGTEPQATTDLAGTFEVSGVPAGSAQATASHPNFAASEPSFLEVDPAKAVSDVRLVLSQGGRVTGSVRRRDGLPLTGMQVRVSGSRSGRMSPGEATTAVQGDGSFAVEHVPAGRASVMVTPVSSHGVQGGLTRSIEVREGETTNVEIVSRDILLTGRATRSGTPAPGLRLEAAGGDRFFGEMGSLQVPPSGGVQRMTATTREDGSFEMLLDEPGTVRVSATTPDGRTRLPSRTIEVPDADSYSVELSFGGVPVSGIVVDKQTDAPLPFASVFAAPEGRRQGHSSSGSTGPDGRFQLEVEPGAYRVGARVREEGYGSADVAVTVGASGLSDVKVALPKGLTITGRVTDAGGRPIGGISLFGYSGDGSSGDTGWGESLADGTFTIGGLKAGTFVVTAGSDTGQFGILRAVAAGTKDASMVLRPGGTLDVSVVGAEGEPVAGAWPLVSSVDGVPVRSMGRALRATDAQGITSMTVPAGQLLVVARKDRVGGTAEIAVAPGERAGVRITIKAGAGENR